MAMWMKFGGADDANSAAAFGAALGASNDATLQALLVGPKDLGHMPALAAYIETVLVEIQMNHVMGNDDKEAGAHLKALQAYIEMSSFTAMLPGGVPVEHVHDVRKQLRMHLECVQEILQERRDDGSQKDQMDPVLAALVDMEPKVALAIAEIERGAQDADLKFLHK
jgi:cytochrome P450